MISLEIIKTILEEFAKQALRLSESDIQKIEKGTHELSVKLVKKKLSPSESDDVLITRKEEILFRLQNCISREEGNKVISEGLKNKRELEQFAKHLDVQVLKKDAIDQIKDKIVEATVGAILRSNAIQGKNMTGQ